MATDNDDGSDDFYFTDAWPSMPDGTPWDGTGLLALSKSGSSPFSGVWDANLLLTEIEGSLGAGVADIPVVTHGSGAFGIHMVLSDGRRVIARLARGDVNMPLFDGFPLEKQVPEIAFQVDTYRLLERERVLPSSRLLYHRVPRPCEGPRTEIPADISGRSLMVFEAPEGRTDGWRGFGSEEKESFLVQAAELRARLFRYDPPEEYVAKWLHGRLLDFKPDRPSAHPPAPTRQFLLSVLVDRIDATIGSLGDPIAWPTDQEVVGPRALAAKAVLLGALPHLLPAEEGGLYRMVLEHGDWGTHNMTIAEAVEGEGGPGKRITSVYDWEMATLVPALLSRIEMSVTVDLDVDADGSPVAREHPNTGKVADGEWEIFNRWAQLYANAIFERAPEWKAIIKAGADVRHLWFALDNWRGEDPEGFFDGLANWAEGRMRGKGVPAEMNGTEGIGVQTARVR